ncbi:MAG: Gfo/Idh/MocA family oxidoreductase [Spirochaetota bacterium]
MLKIGFVGLGTISHENILGYLDSKETEVVAVCRRDEEAARQWLRKWKLPNARYYKELKIMLEKEELDIVEILTPHYLHHSMALQCAQAKVKGISLQKPMAPTLLECDEIIDACRKNNVKLKIYDNFVFYPVYIKAKELINQGLLGELISIRVNTMAGIKEGAPWPWAWAPGTWSMDLKRSGTGPLVGDDGFHKFSLARWFMARDFEKISAWIDPETPLDAPAMIRAKFKPLPGDIPKYAQIDFSFSTKMALPCDFWLDDFVEIFGERGIMWINQCSAGGDRDFFKACEMSKSPVFPPIVTFLNGQVTTYLENITPAERNWSTSFMASTRHFIKVLKEGGEPIYTGEEGKEITRSTIASYISAQENRDVYLHEITTEAEVKKNFKIKTNFCNI